MATNITSLDQFDDLFADYIQQKLGLSQEQVLIAYPQDGQTSSGINEDVIYVHTDQDDDERNLTKNRLKHYDSETELATITQYAMRTLSLHVVFYGPNSQVYQTILYEKAFLEDSKEFFYKNNLALIPDRIEISKQLHEKINGRWWHRADLVLRFYSSVSVDLSTETIENIDLKTITTELEVQR